MPELRALARRAGSVVTRGKPAEDVEAYSTNTNKTYKNWDALVKAESNGYVIVAKLDLPDSDVFRVAVVGPFATKEAAEKARPRYYQRWKKEVRPYRVRTSVRVCWKDL